MTPGEQKGLCDSLLLKESRANSRYHQSDVCQRVADRPCVEEGPLGSVAEFLKTKLYIFMSSCIHNSGNYLPHIAWLEDVMAPHETVSASLVRRGDLLTRDRQGHGWSVSCCLGRSG